MSLKNGQDLDLVSIRSINNPIIIYDDFSNLRIGDFGHGSTSERIFRERLSFSNENFDKMLGATGIISRDEFFDFDQSF